MATNIYKNIKVSSEVESLLDAYVLDIRLPLTFKLKDQAICFKDQDGIKGAISLNNFDIYFGGLYYGKLVSEISFSAPTYSSSEHEIIHFITRRLTKILDANRESIVDIYYGDDGSVNAMDSKFKVDIAGVPNLISEIQTSIKHYCNKTFGIDLSLLENFSDAKKRKISEDAVIKLINE